MNLPELSALLDTFGEARVLLDDNYRIVAANEAYCRDFAAAGESVIGRCCYEVSHRFDAPCDEAGESCPLRDSRASGQAHRVLHLHHTPRGEEHVAVETTPLREASGAGGFYMETMRIVRHASTRPATQGMVGRSPAFMHMLSRLLRVGPAPAAVMLLGETGVGKELAARVIHEASARSNGPFVVVECSGLTETLFESELFGYEKGAFTGANFRKPGLVEAAAGGTLFLDEIGELPLSLQVKLLRLLETGAFRRVGGVDMQQADFRLVCATHRNLAAMVSAETFRRDLYFRINTFPVRLPPLRERHEDLPLLAASLLQRVAPQRRLRLTADALEYLAAQPFSGNIRELRNLLERISLLVDGQTIDAAACAAAQEESVWSSVAPAQAASGDEQWLTLAAAERRYLAKAAAQHHGDRASLARRLGVSERTLFRKLQALAADPPPQAAAQDLSP